MSNDSGVIRYDTDSIYTKDSRADAEGSYALIKSASKSRLDLEKS